MDTALTLEQAAEQMACSTRTIRRLITAKKVKGFRAGNRWRIHQSDLTAHIEAQKKPSPPARTTSLPGWRRFA